MKRHHQSKEAELCAKLAFVLGVDGWEVFHSVRDPRANHIECDLVGVRIGKLGESQTIAIEAKQRLSLAAYSKALHWRDISTFVAVASAGMDAGDLRACTLLWRNAGIGAYVVGRSGQSVLDPIKTSALQLDVDAFAQAARKSSTGLIAPGGSRSPIKVYRVEKEAETAAKVFKASNQPQLPLSEILPHLEKIHRDDVALLFNSKRGRPLGIRARAFGTDWMLRSAI